MIVFFYPVIPLSCRCRCGVKIGAGRVRNAHSYGVIDLHMICTFIFVGICIFSCGKQLYKWLCLSVCVSVMPFFPCSYHWIFMKLTPDIDLMKCLWYIQFQVKRSKVKVTGSFEVFVVSAPWLCAYSTEIFYIHKYRFPGKKVKRSRSHWSFEMKVTPVIRSFYRVRSVAPSLFG